MKPTENYEQLLERFTKRTAQLAAIEQKNFMILMLSMSRLKMISDD